MPTELFRATYRIDIYVILLWTEQEQADSRHIKFSTVYLFYLYNVANDLNISQTQNCIFKNLNPLEHLPHAYNEDILLYIFIISVLFKPVFTFF
jgi:hypothetical protein